MNKTRQAVETVRWWLYDDFMILSDDDFISKSVRQNETQHKLYLIRKCLLYFVTAEGFLYAMQFLAQVSIYTKIA